MARSRGLHVLLAGASGEIEQALRAAGHDVDARPDGGAALAAARTHYPDVVVLDLEGLSSSGGGDPLALARDMRSAFFWRKPLFAVLAGEQRCETCYRDAGIDLLFVKPVEPQLLTGFVNRLWAVLSDYESFDPAI